MSHESTVWRERRGTYERKSKKTNVGKQNDESPVGDITDDVITPAVSPYKIQNKT